MEVQVLTLVFDALAFLRSNAKVFRKYIFLPLCFSLASLFLVQIPAIGLALSTVANSMALALLGMSATRFYLLKNADAVADGANRPFARFFFLTFCLTALSHVAEVFQYLPAELHGAIFMWMVFGIWVNLKLCLAFPALAMDYPGSVWDNVKASINWTSGYVLRIVASFLFCYFPVIFFTMMLMQVPDLMPKADDYWANLPQLIFSNVLIIFSTLWSSIVLAKFYEIIVLKRSS